MKLHEYQAKELFARYGIPVPRGGVAVNEDQAKEVALGLNCPRYVVKAQVLTGGRGKAGGVKLCDAAIDAAWIARDLLGKRLVTHQSGPEGVEVKKVLIAEAVDIQRELYLGLVVDRSRSSVALMVSTEGGMEIEQVAASAPEKIVTAHFTPAIGLLPFQAMRLAAALDLTGGAAIKAMQIFKAAARLFVEQDASLVEINPLVITKNGDVIAVDGKVSIDDNALFRHKDMEEARDRGEDDPMEVEADRYGLNYIKLSGTIGCMVNGAGLAMATMDTIKLYGAEPANFLDVGGGATVDNVAAAFSILLRDKDVKAVMVNIFGGIMRCDVIAAGIVKACAEHPMNRPLVVRLSGTNVEQGRQILAESGLSFICAESIDQAAHLAVDALGSEV